MLSIPTQFHHNLLFPVWFINPLNKLKCIYLFIAFTRAILSFNEKLRTKFGSYQIPVGMMKYLKHGFEGISHNSFLLIHHRMEFEILIPSNSINLTLRMFKQQLMGKQNKKRLNTEMNETQKQSYDFSKAFVWFFYFIIIIFLLKIPILHMYFSYDFDHKTKFD